MIGANSRHARAGPGRAPGDAQNAHLHTRTRFRHTVYQSHPHAPDAIQRDAKRLAGEPLESRQPVAVGLDVDVAAQDARDTDAVRIGAMGLAAWWLGVGGEKAGFGLMEALFVAVAAVAGTLFDSLLGATVEGKWKIDNEVVNLSATVFGAGSAALLLWGFSYSGP